MPGPATSYTPPLFLYRITIGMTAARNVQHVHYYSSRITSESFQLLVPDVLITAIWPNLGRSCQLSDLVQQRLALTGSVLQDLVPKVVNLLTRSSRRVALFEFRSARAFKKTRPSCNPHTNHR